MRMRRWRPVVDVVSLGYHRRPTATTCHDAFTAAAATTTTTTAQRRRRLAGWPRADGPAMSAITAAATAVDALAAAVAAWPPTDPPADGTHHRPRVHPRG